MTFARSSFRGPLQAVVFDWAGTTVDFGCCAPAGVFVEAFRRYGITVTPSQARGPMGTHKFRHVQLLCELPDVQEQWRAQHGRDLTLADVEAFYAAFLPLANEVVPQLSPLIPGVVEAVNGLRQRGLRIGSCSGYVRELMDLIAPSAAAAGYEPEVILCADEVPEGRPSPLMVLENMVRLGVWYPEACVKVGDTVSDMGEGRNAGAWTVGLTWTGNEVGVPVEEFRALSPERQEELHDHAARVLFAAGAHAVARDLSELPAILDDLDARLARGERPSMA